MQRRTKYLKCNKHARISLHESELKYKILYIAFIFHFQKCSKVEGRSRSRVSVKKNFQALEKNFRHAAIHLVRPRSNCHARKRAGGCTT